MLSKPYRILELLRMRQWIKNLLVLFPAFFGGKITDPAVRSSVLPAVISFSFAASCSYIVNDIYDRIADRHHPTKRNRPLARGDVSVVSAIFIAGVLYVFSILLSVVVSTQFEGFVIVYLLISFLYTVYFKHIVIADIFLIAFGFVVRVLAGGAAFNIRVSKWLFLTVFIVAIYLAAGKRLGELISRGADAGKHRHTLNDYSVSFLEGILWFSSSTALVTYALYVIDSKDAMLFTIPVAAYGLLRYIYVAQHGIGDPTDVLLKDRQIAITGLAWVMMIYFINYK